MCEARHASHKIEAWVKDGWFHFDVEIFGRRVSDVGYLLVVSKGMRVPAGPRSLARMAVKF